MPSIDRAALRQTFEHKCSAEIRESRHTVYKFVRDGTFLAQTMLSHARGDESPGMVAEIARQLHLTSSQLKALVDCDLAADEFYAILVAEAPPRRS